MRLSILPFIFIMAACGIERDPKSPTIFRFPIAKQCISEVRDKIRVFSTDLYKMQLEKFDGRPGYLMELGGVLEIISLHADPQEALARYRGTISDCESTFFMVIPKDEGFGDDLEEALTYMPGVKGVHLVNKDEEIRVYYQPR